MKKIGDIGKVRRVLSFLFRNKKIFIKRSSLKKKFLNVGCGPNINKKFINLDYNWRPGVDICWDIRRKYPFKSGLLDGIYSEHCLEHINLEYCKKNLSEFYRILKPGGVLRIILPDGEFYFNTYVNKNKDQTVYMPYEENFISPMARINALFRNHGHQFIYDFYTFSLILQEAGFIKINKASFMQGNHNVLIIDTEYRKIESLYVEAQKPLK